MANASVNKFKRVMNALPDAARTLLRHEIIKQGAGLALAMRTRVPVRLGALRDSIKVNPGRKDMVVVISAGVRRAYKRTTRYEREVDISGGYAGTRGIAHGDVGGVSYDYGIAVEFGTKKMSAQPFFWPTYRAKKRGIRKSIKASAQAGISKLVPLT